jgi:CheY-like chemotaxis protein
MTGYRGRFSIVEILKITPDIERAIATNHTADKIADIARRAGMRALWDSGLSHILRGESTIDELLRVVDVPQEDEEREAERSAEKPARRSGATPASGAPAGRTSGGVAASPAPESPVLSGEFELLEAPAAGAPSRRPDGAKVLLVDDEDQLRRVMRDLLERDGYVVTEAADGVQALDQVDRQGPDIIVLDLNLPGLDGYGVLAHLRSRPATSDIPVVVLTARGDEDSEVRVFELGADDFLSKPFRARALAARLQAVLARSRGGVTRRDI